MMSTQIKNILGVLIILLTATILVFMVVETKNRIGSADPSKTRSITMSAQGKVTARPDTASLSFSVVTQGEEAEDVQTENDEKMAEVIEFIKSQGIDEADIKTSGYNLFPERDYSSPLVRGQYPIVGYSLTQTVSVTVKEIEKVQGLVGGLTSRGINQINNVSYYIDDPDALKSQARDQAIEKAKEKANALADGLGIKLGKVINYTEGGSYIPLPYDRSVPAIGFEGGGGGNSPIESGSQDVTVDVNVVFEIK